MNVLTCDSFVQREIVCCLSSLAATLANSGHDTASLLDTNRSNPAKEGQRALGELIEQAFNLCLPVADYEEAALQAGWVRYEPGQNVTPPSESGEWWYHKDAPEDDWFDSAEALCTDNDIEPYEWEVFEHWAITPWLADKLEEKGERVDKDFAGMCVWARTCSGQGIAQDGVIQTIFAEMMSAK
jgi:hypothetical protein